VAMRLGYVSNSGGGCFKLTQTRGTAVERSSLKVGPAPALFCDTTPVWIAVLLLHVLLLWGPPGIALWLRTRRAHTFQDPEASHGHPDDRQQDLHPLSRLPRPLFYAVLMTFGFWYVAGFSGDMEDKDMEARYSTAGGAMRALMESSMQHFLCGIPYALVLYVSCASFCLPCLDTVDGVFRAASFFHLPFLLGLHLNMARYFLPEVTMGSAMTHATGATVALFSTIVVATLALLAVQAYKIRRARLGKLYLASYAGLVLVLAVLCVFASSLGLTTHLHHSFWPLLVIPTTAFPDPVSMVAQALLTGIVVNGVATYGVESQWETADTLSP